MKIKESSTIEEVIMNYPDTIDVFMDFDIKPIVCGDPVWGTIKEEAEKYKIHLEHLLEKLNEIIE